MNLHNGNESTPASILMRLLKRSGGLTIKEIVREMGVTTNAVRIQINKLEAAGLIEARRENKGRGRPHLIYTLTEKANKVFPRNYEELLSVLLEKVLRIDGNGDKQVILAGLVEKMTERFGEQIKSDNPDERLREFVALLKDRGIMVDIERDEASGAMLLKEFSCPYSEIARAFPEICEIEKDTLARLINTPVFLSQCMHEGHNHCQFRIPKQNSMHIKRL